MDADTDDQLLGILTRGKENFKKKAPHHCEAFLIKDRQRLTLPGIILVPSALAGLTALFGMGRGDPRRYSHLKILMVHSPPSTDHSSVV